MRPGLTAGSRLWWGLPVLAVALWTAGALTLSAFPGLPQPPEITLWGQPATRFARDVTSALTVGALLVGGLLVPQPSRRALRWASGWALAWLASTAALLVFTVSDVFAADPADVLAPGTLWAFLTQLPVGRVFLVQALATVALALLATRVRTRADAWPLVVIAVAASAAPAFIGHGGMDATHVSATVSLGLHIAAVSAWVGGLAVLVALALVDRAAAGRALPLFSVVALWCVIVAAETGLLNATLRVGTATSLVSTQYGTLVLAKGVALGFLVRLGWLQRRRVSGGGTDDEPLSLGRLARFSGAELLIMGAAIGASVALSRIGPSAAGLSTQHFTPVSLVLLGLAVPLLADACVPDLLARWRATRGLLARLRSYPEVPSVVLLVVVAEVSAVGLLGGLLGPQPATVVGALLVIGAGWVWAASLRGPGATAGIVIVMAGWPAVTWLASATATIPADWRSNLVAVVAAEAIPALVLRRARTTAAVAAPEPASMAG